MLDDTCLCIEPMLPFSLFSRKIPLTSIKSITKKRLLRTNRYYLSYTQDGVEKKNEFSLRKEKDFDEMLWKLWVTFIDKTS